MKWKVSRTHCPVPRHSPRPYWDRTDASTKWNVPSTKWNVPSNHWYMQWNVSLTRCPVPRHSPQPYWDRTDVSTKYEIPSRKHQVSYTKWKVPIGKYHLPVALLLDTALAHIWIRLTHVPGTNYRAEVPSES